MRKTSIMCKKSYANLNIKTNAFQQLLIESEQKSSHPLRLTFGRIRSRNLRQRTQI